ncbi:hypothetical protein P7K49_012038, partial [Saguinus oedipus]
MRPAAPSIQPFSPGISPLPQRCSLPVDRGQEELSMAELNFSFEEIVAASPAET